MAFQAHKHNLHGKSIFQQLSGLTPLLSNIATKLNGISPGNNEKTFLLLEYKFITKCAFLVFPQLISKSYKALSHHLQTIPSPISFSLCPFLPLSLPFSLSLSFCKLCLFPVCRGPSGGEVHRKGKAHSEFKCTGLKTQLASTKGNDNGETMVETRDNDLRIRWLLRQ